MIIYWSMLFLTALLACANRKMEKIDVYIGSKYICKGTSILVFIWAAYLLFWIGLRSGMADTNAYIYGFKSIPVGVEHIWDYLDDVDKGVGFQFLAVFFKNFISANYHAWLFTITLVSLFAIVKVYYKRSENFMFTAYLFLASGMFTWLFNGIRQFLAACILLLFSDWLEENKTAKYIVLVLVVSLIHNTALIMIPFCFLLRSKEVWKLRTIVTVVGFVIVINYADSLLGIFTETEMGMGYAEELKNGVGTNVIRVFVAAVPCVLSFVCRKIVREKANSFIKLCVHMSLYTLCFYILSAVTSGVLLGRLPNYFELYNLILLPWLIKHGFTRKSTTMFTILCVALYLIFFYYQMTVTWGMYYVSDFTGRIY